MAAKKTGLGRGLDSLISGGITSKTTTAAPAKKKAPVKGAAKKAAKGNRESTGNRTPPKKKIKSPASGNDGGSSSSTAKQPEAKKEEVHKTATGLYEIPTHLIVPNPHQPRREFAEGSLKEMADSIRSEGLLQPVVVRKTGEQYELIAGERRWRACKLLKLKTIPSRVIEASESSSAVLSLIENLQREDLNPIEEALGLASLLRDFDLTQEAVAERVGRSRAAVANSLRLLQLDREIQAYLSKRHLSVGHAKVLLGTEDNETRLLLARQVIEKGWSVRELEKQLEAARRPNKGVQSPRSPAAQETTAIQDLQKQISSRLSTPVQLKHSPKKGRIIIEYYGNEDLQRILEKMGMQ